MRQEPIPNMPGYFITDTGQVWSEWRHQYISQVLMPNGYKRVVLSKDNHSYNFLVHRLVAQAFIPNPLNLPQVNHLNEQRDDNRAENLAWVTAADNVNYGSRSQKYSLSRSTPVLQINKITNEVIKEWPNAKIAAEALGLKSTNIYSCCNHKPHYLTAGGYKWEYKGGEANVSGNNGQ